MAEAAAAQTPPNFKLVLVGDGGTGKASWTFRSLTAPFTTSIDARLRDQFLHAMPL